MPFAANSLLLVEIGEAKKMNEYIFGLLFLFLSIFTAIPSMWAAWAWSGYGYSGARFRIMVIYTVLFGYLHLGFARDGSIPFMEPTPDSLFRPVSFIFVLLLFVLAR